MIPYGKHSISQADIDAVVEILESEWLTQGSTVPKFEKAVAEYCGSKHAIAMNSATSTLHLACLALGVGKGDQVWTSPITFVASANCALYCGADVDFVDIDSKTYNLSVLELEKKLEIADKNGCLPKVVIPVHLAGQSCDMASIHALSKRYGFSVIEDASHAIGGKYQSSAVGNCKYSDITVFSFHPVKIITTGEGGMALTNNPEIAEKMSRLRSHGITRDPAEMKKVPDGDWYYEQIDLGYNYRMTDIQAALGVSQLKRVDEIVTSRHNIAKFYNENLIQENIQTPVQLADSYSSWHLYIIRINTHFCNKSHKEIFHELRKNKIGVNLHYIPVYKQPFYAKYEIDNAAYQEAEKYYSEAISLPIFVGLEGEQLESICSLLKKTIN